MSQKVTLGFSEVLQSDGKELDPNFSLLEKVVELVSDQCRILCGNHLYDGNALQINDWFLQMKYFIELKWVIFWI